MRKFFMLLTALSLAGLFSVAAHAELDAQAQGLLSSCEQQAQGTADQHAAVMKCLDDKLQYDTSSSGE